MKYSCNEFMKNMNKILYICKDEDLTRLFSNLIQALGMELDNITEIEPVSLKRTIDSGCRAIAIDLFCAPSTGRDLGIYLRKYKPSRFLPLVFLGGKEEEVQKIRDILPDAFYLSYEEVRYQLATIIDIVNENPVVPQSVFEAYKNVPLSKKLGIKPGMRIVSINTPEGFVSLLTDIDDLNIIEDYDESNDLILWFLASEEHMTTQYDQIATMIGKGGIWIIWRKKQSSHEPYMNEVMVRKFGLANDLVDYKICSVNREWTGLKFVRRKRQEPDSKNTIKAENQTTKKYKIETGSDGMLIKYDNHSIPIEIQLRDIKNVYLSFDDSPKLIIKAPKRINRKQIICLIEIKIKWIIDKYEARLIRNQGRPPFQYVNGEKHLFLGVEYEIRIHQGKHAQVRLEAPFIDIEVPDPTNQEIVKRELHEWYAENTTEYVSQRTWYYINQFIPEKWHNSIEFVFRKMKSRWGSCSRTGIITFNKELIKAPIEAIDYVIVHELCHLKQFNHGKDFYLEVNKVLPDWKERKELFKNINIS